MTDHIVDAEIVQTGAELAVREAAPPTLFGTDDPDAFIIKASHTARALASVVEKQNLVKKIGDSRHVLVDGWTMLGSLLGVYASTEWTRQLEKDGQPWGWEARVVARDRAGVVVGAAEAQCTRDEPLWSYEPTNRYGKALDPRGDYALRSMAQTRATSKALRQPLGFVMQLAGFNPTPAEEMPRQGRHPAPPPEDDPAVPEFTPPAGTVPLTDAQMRKIHAVIRSLEDSAPPLPDGRPEDVTDWVGVLRWRLAALGIESRKDLSKKQAGELIDWLERQEVPFG